MDGTIFFPKQRAVANIFILKAYRWIRNMEQPNNLKICKMSSPNLMKIVEDCIRFGLPILLYNIGEDVDPSLEPILRQQTFTQVYFTIIYYHPKI